MIDIDAAFEDFPTLETKRLVLRDLSLDDIPEVEEMNKDAEILKNMHYGVKYGAFDTIMNFTRMHAYKEAITWGIALRESNELIGIRSCFIDSTYEPVTIQGQMRRAYRKQGYTTEAYVEIIRFLEKIGARSIKANADKNNTAAIALLKRVGFQAVPKFLYFSVNDPNPNAILFTKELNPIIKSHDDYDDVA